MRGFPKHINTRADVELLLQEHPEEMKAKLREIVGERMRWLTVAKLQAGDTGLTDETHRVVEVKDMQTGEITEWYQEQYMEDPQCALFRLGITVEEAERWMGE